MRVLMIATSYPKYDGDATAPFIAEIAAGVVAHGCTVRLILPAHREFRHSPVVRGVELIVYRYAPHPALAVWGYAESLHADVKVRRATLLALPFGLVASLYTLIRQILIDRPDVIHAHWLLPNGLPALIASRLFGIPLVVSMHGSDVSMAERNGILRWIAQLIFAHTGAATACSGDLHRRALALGADAETTVVLPYGVTISSFAPEYADRDWVSQRFGVPAQSPLLVAVGRFVHKKGFAVLIHALTRIRENFPTVRLVLAGYGDLMQAYQRAVEERGLSDVVTMPGQLSRDDVARLIASADIYCVPSVHDESGNVDGLPNTLLEGMSAGTAIVASALAGIPDVLSDGHDALLVPAGDDVALADACIRLLGDPPMRDALGIAARQRVLRGLTWPAMTETLVRMYAKVRSL